MQRIWIIVTLLVMLCDIGYAQCVESENLVAGNEFYNLTTSSKYNPKKVLKGSNSKLKGESGKDLHIDIKGTAFGSTFRLQKLCIWSMRAQEIYIVYQGPYPRPNVRTNKEGTIVSVSAVGPVLFRENVAVANPSIWTKTCIEDRGPLTQIWLNLKHWQEHHDDNTDYVAAKSLQMDACLVDSGTHMKNPLDLNV